MLDKLKIPTVYIAVTPDVVMSDLLKTSRSSEIFSITGLPDVTLKPAGDNLHQVEVNGLDKSRSMESSAKASKWDDGQFELK
jgi:adenine-specific DNA-methyltransferase